MAGVLHDGLGTTLAAAQRGDRHAQAALFETHKDRLAIAVMRMTGDPACVDDLVQEVFIAAFSRIAEFRGEASLYTWLYAIAANKVRSFWDSRKRRIARERRYEDSRRTDQEDSAGVGLDPQARLEAGERRRSFYRALGELPTRYREAFVARALENMTLHEASEALGVPVSTLSYRTRRAEEMLCEALGLESPP